MILHPPTIRTAAGEVEISARLEMKTALPNFPYELWYRLPQEYGPCLAQRGDAFAPIALLMAMFAGEDLEARAPISPRLAYNILEYGNLYHQWWPHLYHMVDVRYDRLEAPSYGGQGGGVGTAFSGGVDSFYTLWAHQPHNQPIAQAQVTHGLYLFGYDLREGGEENYKAAAGRYQALFESLGLELIQCSTNAYKFGQYHINWRRYYGASLIGAALLFDGLLGRFYVPSGTPSYRTLGPAGVSPLSDHLLSTETLDVVHHGANVERFEKVEAIAGWTPSHNLLRVCARKELKDGVVNCGACHKCVRTMITLEMAGATQYYRLNFQNSLSFRSFWTWALYHPIEMRHTRGIILECLVSGRFGIALGVVLVLSVGAVRDFAVGLVKKILGKERVYEMKRRVYEEKGN